MATVENKNGGTKMETKNGETKMGK